MNFLRRGRIQASVSIIAGIFFIASFLSHTPVLRGVFLVLGVLSVGALVFASIADNKKTQGELKEIKRLLVNRLDSEVGSREFAELAVRDVQSALEGLKSSSRESQEIGEIISGGKFPIEFKNSAQKKFTHSDFSFSPRLIASTKIVAKPSSQAAGRLAADQVMEDDGIDKLNFLLNRGNSENLRLIETIALEATNQKLSGLGAVHKLLPGQLLGNPVADLSYLVIEEDAFHSGIWRGGLNSKETLNFRALSDHIDEVRANGAVVIVVKSKMPAHFSTTLHEKAHLLIEDGKSNLKWEADSPMPVLETLMRESEN